MTRELPIDGVTSKGQLIALHFGQDAVAASQTDVQLNVVEVDGAAAAVMAVAGYVMPWDYEIVGVAAQVSAAATAGILTAGATIGGTEDADTTVTITTETADYKRVPRGKCFGVAGGVVGCELTTDGDWDATTADLLVTIYVLVYLEGV